MKIKFSGILIGILIAVIACNNRGKEKTPESAVNGITFSDTLEITTGRTVELLPEARAEVSDWLGYATAQDAVANLKGRTGAEIAAASNNLVQIMETLKSTIPDSLRNPAVEARSTVLLTKAKVLYQIVNKREKEAAEVFDLANDIIFEFDNFELQLNEIFLDTPSALEEELEEAFEVPEEQNDTVFFGSPS